MEPGVYAHFDTTEGSFTIRLFEKEAPKTVANFVGLAEGTKEWKDPVTGEKKKAPFYDGVIFHRVINGFMIQGGDPLGQGTGGPGYKFADEFHPSLRHDRAGILSMANAGPEHQRQPVLHHARADAAPRQPSLGLRRGRRRARRRAEDRRRADRPAGSPGDAGRDEQGHDRAGRVMTDDRQRSRLDALLPVVYQELRRLAAAYLRRERPGQTLQPTALVHEAYLRLMKDQPGPLAEPRALLRHRRALDAPDPDRAGAGARRAEARRRAAARHARRRRSSPATIAIDRSRRARRAPSNGCEHSTPSRRGSSSCASSAA